MHRDFQQTTLVGFGTAYLELGVGLNGGWGIGDIRCAVAMFSNQTALHSCHPEWSEGSAKVRSGRSFVGLRHSSGWQYCGVEWLPVAGSLAAGWQNPPRSPFM